MDDEVIMSNWQRIWNKKTPIEEKLYIIKELEGVAARYDD